MLPSTLPQSTRRFVLSRKRWASPTCSYSRVPRRAEGLHHQAVESNAALVVIGSSSRSGLGRLLPGGTAERLLSGSPVPVAVAPEGYAGREAGRAVVGVGFDDSPESHQAVKWASGLAHRSGASLQLLAVHAPLAFGGAAVNGALGTESVNEVLGKELQSQSEKLAEALPSDLSCDSKLFKGDPSTVLVERSQQLDLLVLGSRGYGPVKSVLLGSVSSYVIRNAYCPVLVVPRDGNGELAHSPCLGALLDRDADQVAPLGPGAVVVADVLVAEQLVQHEPGVGRALADPAVGDDRLALGDHALAGVELAQLVGRLEGAVLVDGLRPGTRRRRGCGRRAGRPPARSRPARSARP